MNALSFSICLLLGLLSMVFTATAEENKDASKDTEVSHKSAEENETECRDWEKLYEEDLAKLNFEKAKLEHKKEMLELEYAVLEAEGQKMLATVEADRRRLELENELSEQLVRKEQLRIELRKVKQDYLIEPFQENQLYISDRRISLNGPVYADIADEITHYIHYYNNQNTVYPIFLVIDRCPGGSVMEGARIVEAMRNSKAPVYVVVKSAAVSMCAVITALAERSFAYPNALILHHQMIGLFYGNNTQVSERMKITQEWSQRLMMPVAQKMGIDLDKFVQSMYQHNTEGNWLEFANDAVKLGWVDYVVSSIRETSYIDKPEKEEDSSTAGVIVLEDKMNTHHQLKSQFKSMRNIHLPPLGVGDFYHLYNPDGMYKIAHE